MNHATIPQADDVPFLDIPEAGALLGMSRDSAYRAAREGLLPTVHISRRRKVVPTAALRALFKLDGNL